MKRTLYVFLALVLIFTASTWTFAVGQDDTILSELSDEQCIAFLEDNGIEIPAFYENEIDCVPFVRSLFEQIETNSEKIALIRDPELFIFANAIEKAVEEFYGVKDVSTYVVSDDPDTVEDSTKHGEWLDAFNYYNCYGYAIDDHETFYKLSPGFSIWVASGMSAASYPYNDETDIGTIADWVKQDLENYYGYTVNSVSTAMPNTQVSSHTRLICVRKDLQDMPYPDGNGGYVWYQDFHFMRLDADGFWYHKTGLYGVLKYKYVPTNERAWVQEGYYEVGGAESKYYRYDDYTYESDIYFIEYTTPHKWENTTSNNNGKHTLTCSICGDTGATEDCDLDYTCVNHYYHKDTCADCGYITSKIPCEYTYVGNGSGKHTATCTVCGGSAQLSCTLSYTYYSNNRHRASCSVCKKGFYKNCVIGYTYTGDNNTNHTHTGGCEVCGHTTTSNNTACTFEFVFAGTYSGVNKHKSVCSVCDHVKPDLALCLYKNGDTCTLCGTHKDVHSTAAAGESTEAE